MQVAARTYRAWKTRLPALRDLEDAKVIDTLRSLKVRDSKGRPRPEILYGRRKMTAWLRRMGFPEVSKHTVDRLMRDEGMNGLVRGRKTRTTISGKDGKRAGDLLNRNFHASAPNRIWVTDFLCRPRHKKSYADVGTMPTRNAMSLVGRALGAGDIGMVDLGACFKHKVFGGENRDEKIANGSTICGSDSEDSQGPSGSSRTGRMPILDDRAGIRPRHHANYRESPGTTECLDALGRNRY